MVYIVTARKLWKIIACIKWLKIRTHVRLSILSGVELFHTGVTLLHVHKFKLDDVLDENVNKTAGLTCV